MDNKSFMEKAVSEETEMRKRELIENDLSPFLGGLARRMNRAKVLAYICELPDGEAIVASEAAESCGLEVAEVERILDELEAEGFFDEKEGEQASE